jgi:hypothetical protein
MPMQQGALRSMVMIAIPVGIQNAPLYDNG